MSKDDFPDFSDLFGNMPMSIIYSDSNLRKIAAEKSNKRLIEYRLTTASNDIKRLTPAARSFLSRLHEAFERNGYTAIDRRQIAAILRRPSRYLGAWDRVMLDRLIEAKFIQMKQKNFRVLRNHSGRWHGRGRKYEYEMPIDTGWILYVLKRNKRRKKAG